MFTFFFLPSSQSWVLEIKKEENQMHFPEIETSPAMEGNLPPVRGSNSHLHVSKVGCWVGVMGGRGGGGGCCLLGS